ncbi:MAG: hypothetical protein LCH43_06975 [Actinobacteria bacterium]|nr:hypothetical protein [Actinomycetota bacterium]
MLTRLLSVRIVRWELKLAYIVGTWLAGWIPLTLFDAIGAPALVSIVFNFALNAVIFYYATRVFRGKGEPLEPERQWWRMTAWRPLSLRLGILFLAAGLISVPGIVFGALGLPYGRLIGTWLDWTEVSAIYSTLAYLYLNSATRLKRAGIQRPEPDVKLTPKPKLD